MGRVRFFQRTPDRLTNDEEVEELTWGSKIMFKTLCTRIGRVYFKAYQGECLAFNVYVFYNHSTKAKPMIPTNPMLEIRLAVIFNRLVNSFILSS